jgi:muramoyltetrapeptide carboxypeptidase
VRRLTLDTLRLMRRPRPVPAGGHIRIVSPASPIDEPRLGRMNAMLEERGYQVSLGKHAMDADFYLAGSDKDRADDLVDAFFDSGVDAILCSRGGYGSARLIPHLPLDDLAATRKMLLGYSDITTLHLALNRRGLATVYAPMSVSFHYDRFDYVYESFFAALRGSNTIPFEAPPGKCLVGGTAEGELTGGCLCLLADSLGTPDSLDATGKILLIEDVDENPHRVDAMLTHLALSGVLKDAAGLVIGEMTNTDDRCDPLIGPRPWRDIIQDRLGGLGIPTITDFPCGHMKNMLTLPLGLRVRLDADGGTLEYLETICG